jgi:threonine/homoserine/homoserine lactone efflux protein
MAPSHVVRCRRRCVALAVLLNPGAWLFLGAVASPLFSASAERGGTPAALVAALALMAGAAAGDTVLAVVAGIGLGRAGERVTRQVRRGLALILAALGAGLVLAGVLG